MKATRALLALLLLIPPALAVHLLQVISIDEYVSRRRYQSADDLPLFGLDATWQKHIHYWRTRIQDRSLAVVGPCRPPGNITTYTCRAPAHPLFPLSDSYRNRLLMRPPPDIVRANIEQATNGTLSTVEELVEKVNANLENLAVLSDDEVSLLATNFAEPEARLTFAIGCGPWDYCGWPEDMLVSQDEQRALLAAFLYAIADDGYVARRDAELERRLRSLAERAEMETEQRKEECGASLKGSAILFRERVEALEKEVLIPEAEWVERYTEYVAVLRADVYRLVPVSAPGWNATRPSLERFVDIAEKVVSDDMICRYVAADEPGFIRFLYEILEDMRREYPGMRDGIVRRLAYRRWKMLPLENQAVYMRDSRDVQAESTLEA